jgi:hypothetical protein
MAQGRGVGYYLMRYVAPFSRGASAFAFLGTEAGTVVYPGFGNTGYGQQRVFLPLGGHSGAPQGYPLRVPVQGYPAALGPFHSYADSSTSPLIPGAFYAVPTNTYGDAPDDYLVGE